MPYLSCQKYVSPVFSNSEMELQFDTIHVFNKIYYVFFCCEEKCFNIPSIYRTTQVLNLQIKSLFKMVPLFTRKFQLLSIFIRNIRHSSIEYENGVLAVSMHIFLQLI